MVFGGAGEGVCFVKMSSGGAYATSAVMVVIADMLGLTPLNVRAEFQRGWMDGRVGGILLLASERSMAAL